MIPTADFNLGTARGTIEIDSSGAEAGVDKATRAVSGFEGGLNKASSSMLKTGAAMGGIGVAAVAGFGVAVNAAANFEQRISAIGAVSNASEADLDSFRKLALQLGADTKFGAGEAAGAIEELAKAGIPIPDILGGAAKAVTDLAAAGEVDLTRAAEITANAMNSFSIAGTDAGRVADVFAVAANSSAADVDTLGQSLAQVSAVAATVGLGFEDTIAALELFANKGLKGSDAGTSLKTALLNLQPTTEKQINLFKELGLLTDEGGAKLQRLGGEVLTQTDLFDKLSAVIGTKTEKNLAAVGITMDTTTRQFTDGKGRVLDFNNVMEIIATKTPITAKEMGNLGIEVSKGANAFFDAQGKLRPLVEIQGALQNATKGMTEAQKLATFETIGGSDAVRALSIIAGDTTGQLGNLRGELTAQGQAGETAKKRMDNLKGSMEQLSGSVETALIKIGQSGQGPIRAIVDFLTKLVNAFTNLSPSVQQFIIVAGLAVGILIGMAGAFLLVGGGILKVIQVYKDLKAAIAVIKSLEIATKAWTAVQAAFNAVMALNPIFLIIAGLVLLGAALFIAYQKSEAFRNIVDTIGRTVSSVFGTIVLGVQQFINAFRGAGDVFESTGFVGAMEKFGLILRSIFDFVVRNWPILLAVFAPFIGIPVLIIQNWSTIVSFFSSLPGVIGGFFLMLVNKALEFGANFLQSVVSFLIQLPGKFVEAFAFIIGFWIGFQLRMIGMALEFGAKFITSIVDFLIQLPGRLWDIFTTVVENTASWIVDMLGKAVDLGSRFLNAIIDFFTQLPGTIWGFLTTAFSNTVTWVEDMVGRAIDMGSRFFNGVVEFFSQLPGRVAEFLGNMVQDAWTWGSNMISSARETASNFFNALVDGISGLPGVVLGILDRVIDAFLGVIRRAYEAAKNVASSLWNGFKAGLGIGSPSLIEYAMWDLVDNVESSIKDLRGQIGTIQKMSGLDWGGNIGISSSVVPPGTFSAINGALDQADAAVQQVGATFHNVFNSQADPIAISNQIMWDQRTRVRG